MKQSIGEEVVQWAEKYWHIDKVYKTYESSEEDEQSDYGYFRKVLIEKIESEIKDRLFPENNVFEKDEKYSVG